MPTSQEDRHAVHGALELDAVHIAGYSVELEDADGLVGDQASQTAFRDLLREFQQKREAAGENALGDRDVDALDNDELDRIAASADTDAARTIGLAIAGFSERLADVIARFGQLDSWRGIERIGIGGGFKESAIGRLAIRRAAHRLAQTGRPIALRPLHHAADDAGLVGWGHLLPQAVADARAILAVDIGGTNVRCGIVELGETHRVALNDKWRHADSDPRREDLVEGIARMLRQLVAQAEAQGIALAPFIGVSCPGIIGEDGSILRGAQNLPGDWESGSFHLPRRLCENIPSIRGRDTLVMMHNDAVVQGLSELPWMNDVEHWAVLTIGTGLGNASYVNRHVHVA